MNRRKAYIKEIDDEHLIVQSTDTIDLEWRIPRKIVKMGEGIVAGPWKVFTLGWHGWVITFDDGTHGFLPDP